MTLQAYDPVRTVNADGTNKGYAPKVAVQTPDGLVPIVAPSPDQDPILDHAHGQVTSVSGSAVVLTPPSGCKYADFYSSADVWVRTDDAAAAVPTAAMAGGVPAFVGGAQNPRTLAVTAGVPVRAISASGSAALVVAVPHKSRG